MCVIGSLICNQNDVQTICHNDDPIFTVWEFSQRHILNRHSFHNSHTSQNTEFSFEMVAKWNWYKCFTVTEESFPVSAAADHVHVL